MTGPVPDADAAEQGRLADDDSDALPEAVDIDDDEPAADVMEQAAPVGPGERRLPRDLPDEADAADAAEQSVAVPLDDDDRRE
jgi:hypothetical protein